MSIVGLFEPLTEPELEYLDRFLLDLEPDDSIFCVSELDGFLTAIVIGPDTIAPSEWIKEVWGGDGTGPEWDSVDDFQNTYQLIIRLMNSIAQILNEQPENFEALFLQREVEGKVFQIVDEWCHGFFRGVNLRSDRWDEMPKAIDILAPIILFASPDSSAKFEQLSHEEIVACQELIEPAVREIHGYWLQRRGSGPASSGFDGLFPSSANEPFRREGNKTGRNEVCPCGSGKKYKRCCGLH